MKESSGEGVASHPAYARAARKAALEALKRGISPLLANLYQLLVPRDSGKSLSPDMCDA